MVSSSEFDRAMNINVKAAVFLTQKLRPYFDVEMTRVLFMGSDYVGMDSKSRPEITALYAMTKSALASAVKYLRQEEQCASIGYFNPGTTNTPMFHSIKQSIQAKNGLFAIPQMAQAHEIAQSIQALLENTSSKKYSEINWDYRNIEHQALIQNTSQPSLTLRARM
jgi:short-subunit dehydrogenase